MATQKDGIMTLAGLIFVIVGVTVLVPAMVLSLESPQEKTIDQVENEKYILSNAVETEVTNISNGQEQANVTLYDTEKSVSKTTGDLTEGETTSLTIRDETVDITLESVISGNRALISYSYPTYLGMPAGIELILTNLVLIVLLSTIILITGVLFVWYEVYK